MLQIPPHLINRSERRARDARRSRLGRERYSALVKDLATVIRLAFAAGATASPWGLEGPLRAAIRCDLCLQHWRWHQADTLAREALEDAFHIVRAVRPAWNEGQREWTIEAGTLIERTRCARCHKKLPAGHHKFCSRLCSTSHAARLSRFRQADEEAAVQMAVNLE
jgi:hypothetical protein